MKLNYRRATTKDIPLLITLEKSAVNSRTYSGTFKESEWLEEIKNGPVYIIEKDGEAVGDIMYEIQSEDHAYIDKVLVVPTFQGQGVARNAIKYILHEIGEVKRIDLVTHPDNYKAIKLYESFGFTIESRKENYFGDGEPRVVMALLRK